MLIRFRQADTDANVSIEQFEVVIVSCDQDGASVIEILVGLFYFELFQSRFNGSIYLLYSGASTPSAAKNPCLLEDVKQDLSRGVASLQA